MENNRKFKTWELLIVFWAGLSGLAFLLKFWEGTSAIMIDSPWFRLNHLGSLLAYVVMMYLRVRREKQEAKHSS